MWSSGRGFSRHINEVKSLIERADGSLEIVADGFNIPSMPGEWKLVVDPQNGYIVRRATFSITGNERPKFDINTFGSQRYGDCVLPEHSTIAWTLSSRALEYRYVFTKGSLAFDSDHYQRAATIIEGPFPPGSMIKDARRKPARIVSVRRNHSTKDTLASRRPVLADPSPGAVGISRRVGIILTSSFIALLVAAKYFLRRKARSTL
jgi:hypothetical protein